MAKEQSRLKLGKRASFVKSSLKLLPQEGNAWEVDFRELPKQRGRAGIEHLGVVVALPKGNPLAYLVLQYRPSVNDLADLLADAMQRPLTASPHRPKQIHFRANPRWDELLPHLKQLGIQTSVHDDLPKREEAYEDFLREVRRSSPKPFNVISPGRRTIDEQYPAIAQWVQEGHIEIGHREKSVFVVRALSNGNLAFEDDKPKTLAEAMAALENGLQGWYKEQGLGIDLVD